MTRTVAVVTGGSRGIGRAVVERLARRGHAVVFTYTTDAAGAADVVGATGPDVRALRCDITDTDAPARILAAAGELGSLTALVNNAGITGPLGLLTDTPDEVLRRVVDVDLVAAMRLCREAIAVWERDPGKGRSIVNVSSVAARTGAPGEYVWYAAAKAGLDSFTVGLAKEVAGRGIRVNAVRPGTTDTTIHARAGRPHRAAEVGARTPLGRPGAPDEIAAAIEWLTTPDAAYVTGAVLDVSGGAG